MRTLSFIFVCNRSQRSQLTNRMALGKIQKDLGPKFKTADLETIGRRCALWGEGEGDFSLTHSSPATDLYVAYQKAFASADMNAVRDLVAPHVFTKVKDTFPEHKPGEASEAVRFAFVTLPPGTRYEWSGVVSSSRVCCATRCRDTESHLGSHLGANDPLHSCGRSGFELCTGVRPSRHPAVFVVGRRQGGSLLLPRVPHCSFSLCFRRRR